MAKQEAFSLYVPALLNGVGAAFFFPITPTPEELYNKIWGYVQDQISSTVMFKSKAQLVLSLISLTKNLNQQVVGYLVELQLLNQTPESLFQLIYTNNGTLNATRDSVDVSMKAIDTILASSFDWYNPITINQHRPSTFILGSALKGVCLHTREFNIIDGTEVLVDNECDLNNLADKSWSLDSRNRLLLRTTQGLKCLAYNGKSGTNLKRHLAIFGIESFQCAKGRLITLHHGKSSGEATIHDGTDMICVSSNTASKNLHTLVTTKSGKKCKDKILTFDTIIPIPLDDTDPDNPGTNLEPARSFEEIGIQLFYFSKIAALHLMALKELYNYGTLQKQAEYQFYTKVAQYKKWLEVVLPMYASYSMLMNINSTEPIAEATVFYRSLKHVNLTISPMLWNLEKVKKG